MRHEDQFVFGGAQQFRFFDHCVNHPEAVVGVEGEVWIGCLTIVPKIGGVLVPHQEGMFDGVGLQDAINKRLDGHLQGE